MIFQILEERTVKVLALLGVLAFLGMVVMPMAVGDIGYSLGKRMGWDSHESELWGATIGAVGGAAIGGCFGGLAGAGIGLTLGGIAGAA